MTENQRRIKRLEAEIIRDYVRIVGLESPIATALIHGAEALAREADADGAESEEPHA